VWKAADVSPHRSISDATFYYWKRKYGGMGVSELGPLRQF
jgi:hypothetical protein